jgi:hypothetical protein
MARHSPVVAPGEVTTMWPQRRLTELLQIVHPLILATMAGLGTVELAASVRRWRSRLDRLRAPASRSCRKSDL